MEVLPTIISINLYKNIYTIIYIMKGTCLRCGKEFSRLDKHLLSKNECPANYLDVSRELMIRKYDSLLKDFKILKEKEENYYKCHLCNKYIKYQSNYSRHMKKHKEQNNQNNVINNTNGTTNIITDSNNNTINDSHDTINNINITLNNFGLEKDIDTNIIKDILKGVKREMIASYIEKEHIDIEENRNIYLSCNRNKHIMIFKDGKWQREDKKYIESQMFEKAKKKLNDALDFFYDQHKERALRENVNIVNTGVYKIVKDIREFLDTLNHDKIQKEEEVKIEYKLLDNKDILYKSFKSL